MTDELEQRLRRALAGRAGQITQSRLRFGVPPTAAAPARSFGFGFPPWLAALSGAVIAALVLGLTLRTGGSDPAPVQPVAPPPPVSPASPAVSVPADTPSPATSPGTPQPSTSAIAPAGRTSGVSPEASAGPAGAEPSAPDPVPQRTASSARLQTTPGG